jgi:hypothetical protein
VTRDPVRAALAWVKHEVPHAPGLCLVCEVDLDAVTVTLCTGGSGVVTTIDCERQTPGWEVDARLCDARVHRASALRGAEANPRFRDARLYDGVRTGEILDAFALYGALVRDAVERLLARNDNLEVDALGLVVVGALARFPLVADVIAASAPGIYDCHGETGTEDVVRTGMELLRTGAVEFDEAYRHALQLRTSEIRAGVIVNGHSLIAPAGSLTPGGDHVGDLEVTVASCGEPFITIDVAGDALVADVGSLSPGTYTLSTRLVRGGAEVRLVATDGQQITVSLGPLPSLGGGSHDGSR